MSAPAAPTPVRRRRIGAWLGALFTLLGVLLMLGSLLAAAWWSVRTERGSAWLLSVLPGVQVEAPRGSLLGDFDAQRVTIRLPGDGLALTFTDVGWRGLTVERARTPLWLRVAVDRLHAGRVDIVPASPRSAAPIAPPDQLRLPIELELRALRIDALHTPALGAQPLREIDAQLHLGADAGAEHRIERLALAWDRLQASGSARIGSGAPMELQASIDLVQQAAESLPAWNAKVVLAGPLAEFEARATLRAAPVPKGTAPTAQGIAPTPQRTPPTTQGTARLRAPARAAAPPQTLDARATLRPFAAWPLGELQASTRSLDLSAFASDAPATALSGEAVATSTAAEQPASITLSLTNELAGRWNEGRLPLRSLALELAARPDQPTVLDARRFDAELGTERRSAGRITGSGGRSGERWSLAATLQAVDPALLDARAASMPLSGSLELAGSAAADGAAIDLKARLDGRVTERRVARAVRLELDGSVELFAGGVARRIELRTAQAAAGNARATLAGTAARAASAAPWAVKAQATLADFDPAVWWLGPDGAPWRNAKTRLDASGSVDLVVPVDAAARSLPDALAALRGRADLDIRKTSLLAGVPLSGTATLRNDTGAGTHARATLALDAAGNRVRAEGRIATTGNGAGDAWDVSVDAAALARLQPVFRLYQPAGASATLAGALEGSLQLTGRWPALSTTGRLEANGLHIGELGVAQARARWTLGHTASAPAEAQLTLTQLQVAQGGAPGPSLESLSLQLQGTGRAHTLEVRARSKARPPEWAETLQAGAAPAGGAHTLGVLQLRGGLIEEAGAPAGWRGTLGQLDVRSSAANATPLLQARDLAIEALWAGGPARASVQPGRADLLGGALRWSRLAWQAPGGPGAPARIDVDAVIEPLRIAPLLARAQPDFGWGGDLTVGGSVQMRSGAPAAPGLHADIVIERRAGDLSVTEELGTRALGLTDLRFGLSAAGGVWSFTLGIAGQTVGVLGGAVVARTVPEAVWPPAEAPLEGVLELRVADLGTWGNWVPPGWRLGGALHANASFGGRFGAPEYTGRIDGTRLAVRNFLEGVNVVDGDVAIRLQGTSATIERFTAKAGDGSVRLAGNASFGTAPKAVLQVSAERFQLLGRVDRRIVTSGSGQLQLDASRLAFDGSFKVDEGLIDFTRSDAPALSSDVTVVRARGVASPAAAASAAASPVAAPADTAVLPSAPRRDVDLDLRVALGEALRLRGRGLDTGLRGELHITSPGGRLAVNGTVQAADGTYAAYGQKLAIDRGVIVFVGPIENPRLDIEATRPNLDVRVGVAVTGTATNPRIRLFSEPELSEIDKLSWLVLGRAGDTLGRTDTALLQRAALALLAGEGTGPTDQLTKAIGLDEISVRQTDGEVRDTVISLGKQLSRRWYVGYEHGLNATTGNFQLIYRIARQFTLRAQSGQDNSLDLIWSWRWQ